MKNPLLRLRETSSTLSPTEREVANHILNDPSLVTESSIHELARQTYSSPSTIVRLCTHLGYSGYRDFRRAVASELAVREQSRRMEQKEIERTDSTQEIIDKITYRNIVSLEETRALLNTEVVARCVHMIHSARVLYLFGMGASFCTAKDAYLKFLRMNKMCVINEDWHSQLLQARNATSEDVAVVISYSGATVEIVQCMEALKANHTPIIAITRLARSKVSELADERLYIPANESLFRTGAMASRISQLNIIDVLYTCLNNMEFEHSLDQLSKTHIHKPDEE